MKNVNYVIAIAKGSKESCSNLLNAMKIAVAEEHHITLGHCFKNADVSDVRIARGMNANTEFIEDEVALMSIKRVKDTNDGYVISMPLSAYLAFILRTIRGDAPNEK